MKEFVQTPFSFRVLLCVGRNCCIQMFNRHRRLLPGKNDFFFSSKTLWPASLLAAHPTMGLTVAIVFFSLMQTGGMQVTEAEETQRQQLWGNWFIINQPVLSSIVLREKSLQLQLWIFVFFFCIWILESYFVNFFPQVGYLLQSFTTTWTCSPTLPPHYTRHSLE